MSQEKDSKTKTWSFRCRYINPLTNEYVNVRKRGFKSKKEAKIAEVNYLENINIHSKERITFQYIYDDYFNNAVSRMKTSSYNSMKNKSDNHILPYFNNKIFIDISIKDVHSWKEYLIEKELSLVFRRDIFIMFSTIMRHGNKYFLLNNNAAELEGNFKEPYQKKKEMLFWTEQEFNQFNEVLDNIEYKTLFNFLYWTGCRRGEALALTWNDFTSQFKHVNITKTINQKVSGKPYEITNPKTPGSVRRISLPNQLIKLLQELYEYSRTFDGFSDNCFVFGLNKPFGDTTIETRKNRYCQLAKVKQIRIHDFRHSHASYLIHNMPNDKNLLLAISSRLGHSDPNITLKTYAHMMPSDEDKLLDILNK